MEENRVWKGIKKIGLTAGVGLALSSMDLKAQQANENTIPKSNKNLEMIINQSLAEDKTKMIRSLSSKSYVDNVNNPHQQELLHLVTSEVEQEKQRMKLLTAVSNLMVEKKHLKLELERLYELHKDSPSASKAIRDLLRNLESDVHVFVTDKLKETNLDIHDNNVMHKAKNNLSDMLVNGGGPIGNMVISLALIINKQVGEYSGQFSQDMQNRNLLSDLISKLAKAECDVYFEQGRYDSISEVVNQSHNRLLNMYKTSLEQKKDISKK